MVIVVSGTHASGKTSLIEDFAAAHSQFGVLLDPFETLDEYATDTNASIFYQQLEVSAARLLHDSEGPVIAERGPLDFLAYLDALEQLERPRRSHDEFHRGVELCIEAMAGVDLLVLLPLNSLDRIDVPEDEDPQLRHAMDEALLTLAGDDALTGGAEIIEVAGSPDARLARIERAVASLCASPPRRWRPAGADRPGPHANGSRDHRL